MPSFSEIKMVSFIYLEEASFTQHTQQLKLRRLCYCQYFIMNKLGIHRNCTANFFQGSQYITNPKSLDLYSIR